MGFRLLAAAILLLACGGGLRRFPAREPMLRDDDQRPFVKQPRPYFSPFAWDGADKTIFRPLARLFTVDPAGEAVNVNALDEVPDSSWFVNRIGTRAMSPEEVARGPCETPLPDPQEPWSIVSAVRNAVSIRFLVEVGGRRWLVKLEDKRQPERSASAEVVGSRIYHAAGFNVGCTSPVLFRRDLLAIAPGAEAEDVFRRKKRLTEAMIDDMLNQATRLADGRYRASAGPAIDGKALGPFRYHGVRDDDPNDVVRHEDRRELRGSALLAAWIGYQDAREFHTRDFWIDVPGRGGYVRHYILDWNDALGGLWTGEDISRRVGHAFYFDFAHILADFVTLGIPERPWDRARYGPAGVVWGYFDVDRFDPDAWRPGYPNPAFSRMRESDAAWMARIIARFSDDHVRAIVDEARISNELARRELVRILLGRRDKILARYLGRLSPLTAPRVVDGELCLDDLAPGGRDYRAGIWRGERREPLPVRRDPQGTVCATLPAGSEYLVVDVVRAESRAPARVHLQGGKVLGLERPAEDTPP